MDPLRSWSLLLLVAWFSVTAVFTAKNRKMKLKRLECPETICNNYNESIIHVQAKATDNSSTIHYLWTTYPVPTIVVAYTVLDNVSLNINWTNLIAHGNASGIEFYPAVNYTFGFAIPIIYEYDDDDDMVKLSDNSKMIVHKLSNMTWTAKVDNSSIKATFTGDEAIVFECIASNSEGRESSLPHLLHTADSSRFSFSLKNMNVSTNNTRFAFELSYIVDNNHTLSVSTDKSIDDEYTPAVFETVYGKVTGEKGKSYSQWKPIAYTKPKLGRMCQTRASASGIEHVTNRSWNIGERAMPMGKYHSYGLNVSFGLSKDGFYTKNKYLTWSGIVGYGEPAKSTLSFFVILIISIGLGLPLAIIIFGGTYVQLRKHCCKANESISPYERIN